MDKESSLKVISRLSSVIGMLEYKWERPFSNAENTIMHILLDTRETVRKAHEVQQTGIIATEDLGDNGWHAWLASDQCRWELGRTEAEAVGKLMRSCPDIFGLIQNKEATK